MIEPKEQKPSNANSLFWKQKNTYLSVPYKLAVSDEYKDIIKEKIRNGCSADPDFKLLLEKLPDPTFEKHTETLKQLMLRIIDRGKVNIQAQHFLEWLINNRDEVKNCTSSLEFEDQSIDLYVRDHKVSEQQVINKAARQSLRWQIPDYENNLIIRSGLLDKLDEQLYKTDNGIKKNVITGIGGTGKTYLAFLYVQRHSDYQAIIWIHGEVNLSLEFKNLAKELSASPTDLSISELVKNIYKKLDTYDNWLVIFDNALDPSSLNNFLPSNTYLEKKSTKRHILITSRNEIAWQNAFPIDGFTPQEAKDFLKPKILNTPEEQLDKLAETLDFLPLAIEQAVAYITNASTTVTNYLEEFKHNPQKILRAAKLALPAEATYSATVYKALMLSIKKLKTKKCRNALKLLWICSYLDPSTIPRIFLEHCVKDCDEALAILKQYSLIKVINNNNNFPLLGVHRLVQEVTRIDLDLVDKKRQKNNKTAKREVIIRVILKQLDTHFCYDRNDSDAIQASVPYIKHIHAVFQHLNTTGIKNLLLSRLVVRLAAYYLVEFQDIDSGRDLLEKINNIIPQTASIEQTILQASIANYFGFINYVIRDLEAALNYCNIAKDLYSQVYPDINNVDKALCLCFIGHILCADGKYKDATVSYKSAFDTLKKIQDQNTQRDKILVLKGLGDVYFQELKLAEALDTYERVLKLCIAFHKTEQHIEIAIVTREIAQIYFHLGDYINAKKNLLKAITIFEKKANSDMNMNFAFSYKALAHSCFGLNEDATAYFLKLIAIYTTLNVTDKSLIADAYHMLGKIARKANNKKTGDEYFEKCLTILTNFIVDIEESKVKQDVYNLIGYCQNELGRYSDAISTYDKAIKYYAQDGYLYIGRGFAKLRLGKDAEDALNDYNRAIAISPKEVSFYIERAKILCDLVRLSEAIEDYTAALRLEQKAEYYNNRANLYFDLENYDDAIADYSAAIDMNNTVPNYFINRAKAEAAQQQYPKAILDYDNALKLVPNAKHFNARGNLQFLLENYAEAKSDYLKAIELDPADEIYIANLADAEYYLKDYTQAILHYDKTIASKLSASRYFNRRGCAKLALYRNKEAIEDFTQAIERAVETSPIDYFYMNRGLAKTELEQYASAIEDFTQAINKNPREPLYFNHRGYVEFALQKYVLAARDFRKAMELNPGEKIYALNYATAADFILSPNKSLLPENSLKEKSQTPRMRYDEKNIISKPYSEQILFNLNPSADSIIDLSVTDKIFSPKQGILQQIFHFLDNSTLIRAGQINKNWYLFSRIELTKRVLSQLFEIDDSDLKYQAKRKDDTKLSESFGEELFSSDEEEQYSDLEQLDSDNEQLVHKP